jgi:TIGR03009 family protein
MRALGFISMTLFIGVAAGQAQQPIPGAAPAGQPAAPAQPPAAVQVPGAPLDTHLAAWEKTMAGVVNIRMEMKLKRTDGVFKKEKNYKGVALCMKPNYAILRLDNLADPTKMDYEAYICNGRSVYQYSGTDKTVTEYKLPPADPKTGGGGTDNLMLDILSGKASDAKKRFDITKFNEDNFYVYLDIKPLAAKDAQEFKQIRMALYGPNTKQLAYLPAQILKYNANGDTESWEFSDHKTNLPGIDVKVFEYTPVPGFQLKQYQPPPPQQTPVGRPGQPMLPGANGLPAGPGVVRP